MVRLDTLAPAAARHWHSFYPAWLLRFGVKLHLTHFPYSLAVLVAHAGHFLVVAGGAGTATVAGIGRTKGLATRHSTGRYDGPRRRYGARWCHRTRGQYGLGQGHAGATGEGAG